jgi:hypothetical protein
MAIREIDAALTVALAAVSGYFAILNVQVMRRYLRFRQMRGAALLTWAAHHSSSQLASVGLGILGLFLAITGLVLKSPILALSQGISALYFLGAVRLLMIIRTGFYVPGIWAEGGFVPYEEIARWAIRDSEEIVLLIVRRGRAGALRLSVPRDDYGAVTKLLGLF